MGKISEIFNFENIGSKIKNLAKWSCWITILLIWIATPILIISAIAASGPDAAVSIILFPIFAFVASVVVWIGNWTMYAFGEFVEDVHAIRDKKGDFEQNTVKTEYTEHINKDSQAGAADPKPNSKKAIQCECGELYYGLHCPICGKSSKNQIAPQQSSMHITKMGTDKSTKKSHLCKCGERFYGETCPNCGRTPYDL